MCKYFGKEPDDDWFENLPSVKRLWMYESWCQDLEDKNEFAKSFSIFLGCFSNIEAAQQMLKRDQPDYGSTDRDFEESTRMVLADRERQMNEEQGKPKRRRKRRRRVVN
jgi:hypothetical protein